MNTTNCRLFVPRFRRPENRAVPRTGQMSIGLAVLSRWTAASALIFGGAIAGSRPMYAGTGFVSADRSTNFGSIHAAVNSNCGTTQIKRGTYTENVSISRSEAVVRMSLIAPQHPVSNAHAGSWSTLVDWMNELDARWRLFLLTFGKESISHTPTRPKALFPLLSVYLEGSVGASARC
jgi:hypothetical protein